MTSSAPASSRCSRHRARPFGLIVFLAVCTGGAVASAQDEAADARLAWVRGEGAESCPDAAHVSAQVVSILGRDPFGAAPSQDIEGVVERRDGAWVARLYVRTAGEASTTSREFSDRAASCEGVTSSVALAIALSIDPTAALRPLTAPPSPTTTRPPSRPRRAPAPRDDGATMELRAAGLVGLLPGVTPGLALAGEPYVRGRFRLLLAALYAPETRVARFDATFAFGLGALSAAGCFDLVAGRRASFAGCAGGALGAVHSVVFDLRPYSPGERVWVGVSASARLTVRLVSPLVAVLGLDAMALPLRARFHLERTDDVVYEQSVVALTGYVGLGLSFR